MARFRAPSVSSSDGSVTQENGQDNPVLPSTPVQRQGRRTSARLRGNSPVPEQAPAAPRKVANRGKAKRLAGSHREANQTNVSKQFRFADKKAKLKAQAFKDQNFSYVFVGNLNPSVTENEIGDLFEPCGLIRRICLRASRGSGVTRYAATLHRDRCYATVEFKRNGAARAALGLNGKELGGLPVVVCLSPADLPEVQDIMNSNGWLRSLGNVGRRIRPLAREKTEIIVEAQASGSQSTQVEPPARHTNHRVNFANFAVSFPKCLI